MKIPLPDFSLKNLKNQPLPEITPEDVVATLERAELDSLQQRKDAILAKFEQETSKNISNEGFKTPMLLHEGFKTPLISNEGFRTPMLFKGRKNNLPCTPTTVPNSVNFGFSLVATPRTPATLGQQSCSSLTPSLSQRGFSSDGFLIPTPMVLSALDNFQRDTHTGTSQLPDILDFIDDDTHDMEAVENHILQHSELELTDNNVVDYLLETTEDLIPVEEKPVQKPKQQIVSVWGCLDDDQPLRRITRRRYLHSKVITAEMEKSLREIQKKKEKERRKERKERFKKASKGTRKSSRRKSNVKYY